MSSIAVQIITYDKNVFRFLMCLYTTTTKLKNVSDSRCWWEIHVLAIVCWLPIGRSRLYAVSVCLCPFTSSAYVRIAIWKGSVTYMILLARYSAARSAAASALCFASCSLFHSTCKPDFKYISITKVATKFILLVKGENSHKHRCIQTPCNSRQQLTDVWGQIWSKPDKWAHTNM